MYEVQTLEPCERCQHERTEPGQCPGCGLHGPEDCEDCGKFHMPAHLHYEDTERGGYIVSVSFAVLKGGEVFLDRMETFDMTQERRRRGSVEIDDLDEDFPFIEVFIPFADAVKAGVQDVEDEREAGDWLLGHWMEYVPPLRLVPAHVEVAQPPVA